MPLPDYVQQAIDKPGLPEYVKRAMGEDLKIGPIQTDSPKTTAGVQVPGRGSTALKNTESFVRPVLEVGGLVGGGTLGTPAGPVGQLGGAGLGFAAGRELADLIFGADEGTFPEELLKSGKDVIEGAAFEAGGQVVGKFILEPAVKKAVAGLGKTKDLLLAFSRKQIEKEAGKVLRANTSAGPIFAKNAEAAAQLEKEIPGLKFSVGQAADDPALIKLERTQMRTTGAGAAINAEQQAANDAAIASYYKKNFGGKENIDDVINMMSGKRASVEASLKEAQTASEAAAIPGRTPQQVGEEIGGLIDTAQQPFKAGLDTLESAIPDYPMSFNSVTREIKKTLANRKLSSGQKQAVQSLQKKFTELVKSGKTTHTALGLNRTLNEEINKAFAQDNKAAGALLLKIKDGLASDLANVGKLARTGKLKTFKGKAVEVDALARELESNLKTIAEREASLVPDLKKMVSEINKSSEIPTHQVVGESNAGYLERITTEFRKVTGRDVPTTAKPGTKEFVATAKKRVKTLKDILSQLEPGQDVGAAMNAYNSFASEQFFKRFATPTIKRATGSGILPENIPVLFKSETGANDLIKAIGKDNAKRVMTDFSHYDLLRNAIDPKTGLLSRSKFLNWQSKNKRIIKKFGIDLGDFEQVTSTLDDAQQAAKDFERSAATRMLKADPETAIKKAFGAQPSTAKTARELKKIVKNNKAADTGLKNAFADFIYNDSLTTAQNIEGGRIISSASYQKLLDKYMPAIRVIYKEEPNKINALKNIQKAYTTTLRNKKSPIGGGSDTAENILTELAKSTPIGRSQVFNIIRMFSGPARKYRADALNDMLNRALFNPEYANSIIAATKTNPAAAERIINNKIVDLAEFRAAAARRVAAGTAAVGAETNE